MNVFILHLEANKPIKTQNANIRLNSFYLKVKLFEISQLNYANATN